MIGKLSILLLVAVAINANPGANTKWRWTPKRVTVSPNTKALPFPEYVAKTAPLQSKFVGTSTKVAGCGFAPLYPSAQDTKIVGGDVAPEHLYPWQVAVYIDNSFFCGGSVISDDVVLTAGHCVDGAQSFEIVFGAHDLSLNEASQETRFSTNYIQHEEYSSVSLRNDIAVIFLDTPLVFNDFIQPVCLPPSGSEIPDGTIVTATGWGKDHDGIGGVVDQLRYVDVPTIDRATCGAYYGDLFVTDDMLCIDATDGHGTCNGDSGGPLNYVDPADATGRTESRGVVSYGASAGCESGAPDAFTKLSHYVDWIFVNSGVTR